MLSEWFKRFRAPDASSPVVGNRDLLAAQIELPRYPLPEPQNEFLLPPAGDDAIFEKSYFDADKWDAQFSSTRIVEDSDPVERERGKVTGSGSAALFVSDFHLGDGSAAGDDFLDSHIMPDKRLGIHTGHSPAGESRAKLFASVLSFSLERIRQATGDKAHLDLVLNGDIVNMLELKGRGSTLVSVKHKLLFHTLAVAHATLDVYWLRGNHDYIVPVGPWQLGEFYVNEKLQILAEHGDFWDSECWPPGPENNGSRLVIEIGALFESTATLDRQGSIEYLMSGIDNLRPWTKKAIQSFLDRRRKHSDVARVAAAIARMRFMGAADDYGGYQGALKRRKSRFPGWLMVQGHTHVPAFVPGVYYNTGSWIPTLIQRDGQEEHLEMFPFLLVYRDALGRRLEEYYTVQDAEPGRSTMIQLENEQSIEALRRTYGYKKSIP